MTLQVLFETQLITARAQILSYSLALTVMLSYAYKD